MNDKIEVSEDEVAASPSTGVVVPFDEVEIEERTNLLPPVPDFEGRKVDRTVVKVTGMTTLERLPELLAMHIGDRVRLVLETRVSDVKHFDKEGALIREHLVRVQDACLAPWDPNDPTDYGVIGADA